MASDKTTASLRNRALTVGLAVSVLGFCWFLLRANDGDHEPMGTWRLVEMRAGADVERTLIVIETDAHDPERFVAVYCTGDRITAHIGVGARIDGGVRVAVSHGGEIVADGIWTDTGSGALAADSTTSLQLTRLLLNGPATVQLHATGLEEDFRSTLTVGGITGPDLVARIRSRCSVET